MRTLLISDLHMQEQRPDITRALFYLLDQFESKVDQLFILGDFFELWLGDDYLPEPAPEVADRLAAFADAGTRIFIMHGNRDFLLGKQYAARCGATLINEPYQVELAARQCLLMHGDTLCTGDIDYLNFRSMVRNPDWQQQFVAKSIEQRIAFGQQARDQSKADTAQKDELIMDVTHSEVVTCFERSGADVLIHGHTHRPAIHAVKTSCGDKTRMVLGDWHKEGWYILADNKTLKLERFAFPE